MFTHTITSLTVNISSVLRVDTVSETQKAYDRRVREGWFDKHLRDPGIDIGCGSDLVAVSFRGWDLILGSGDAQKMGGVPDESFMTVYCSHVLEHLTDPVEALYNWFRILMPGGYLIVIVPHRDLYEKKKELPSYWSAEHKTFWLPHFREEPDTWGLEETLKLALPEGGWELEVLRVLDAGYNPNGNLHSIGEYSIEVVVRRLEMEGRLGLTPCNEYYAVPEVEGKRVLEVGCQGGSLGKHVMDLSPTLYCGIDIWRYSEAVPEVLRQFRFGDIRRRETLPLEDHWDVVICFDVLYHLRDPLTALENLRDLTSEVLVVGSAVHPGSGVFMHFEPGYRGDPSNCWYPSRGCLEKMFRWLGFRRVEVKFVYKESELFGVFHDRICFHCWRG